MCLYEINVLLAYQDRSSYGLVDGIWSILEGTSPNCLATSLVSAVQDFSKERAWPEGQELAAPGHDLVVHKGTASKI